MNTIERQLAELTKQCDPRLSVFDVEISNYADGQLELSGCALEQRQVDELPRLFPDLKVDTASIRILSRPNLPRLSVATNLTGLYEKPTFGMPLSSELYFGTELEVLDEEKNWVFTRQKDGYLGWVHKPYLTDASAEATHLVIAPSIELRSTPQAEGEIISRLVSGTGVIVESAQGAWSLVLANKKGWVQTAALRAIESIPASMEEKRKKILEDSARMIGVPYLWGGTSGNGIDCSGFARLLHRWVGIDLPRDADLQCQASRRVNEPFEIGDLFFFGEGDSNRDVTHVGISLGGWKMIHSSRGNNGVYVDDLREKEALKNIFMRAGSFLR
ncbi:MAG: C40 family peptidase [Anaerolineales bacterium]|nr:C40 family peptidase [Anaerolineales bacterium]MCZ2122326.1 NlpC/P60 family protein [Anaerolineales bacterium]